MSSQSSKVNQARWRQDLLLSVLPIDGFRKARDDVIDLFGYAYQLSDDIPERFRSWSRPELREWAIKPYPSVTNYDPHEKVMRVFRFGGRIKRFITRLLLVILVVASVLSLRELSRLAMNGLELTDATDGVLPLSVIALSILCVWLLKTDTFAHQTLARELRIGRARVMTRNESQIVGCGVWNRSLIGQRGLILVAAFFLLRSLGDLPFTRRVFDDPANYVKGIITGHMDIFLECDSWMGAVKRLWRRLDTPL